MLAVVAEVETEGSEQKDYIPKDNQDLVRVYGTYVTRLVTRYNRVHSNFDDLLQHVWMKLFENHVVEKHRASLGHLPKQLTGAQAAAYLQMPWFAFLKRVNRGVKRENLALKIFRRDRGVCSRCKCDMIEFGAALQRLRQDNPEGFPIITDRIKKTLGADHLPVRFWALDSESVDARTICYFCAKKSAQRTVPFAWYPVPAKGPWTSRTALYNREDVERLKLLLDQEKDRVIDPDANPASALCRSFFKQYLARSIHNIYANWCRTRARRYQEQYKGNDESTGRAWEETLGDPRGARQESVVELSRMVKYLAGSGDPSESTEESESEVLTMFEEGKSVTEVARKMNIRPKILQAHTS